MRVLQTQSALWQNCQRVAAFEEDVCHIIVLRYSWFCCIYFQGRSREGKGKGKKESRRMERKVILRDRYLASHKDSIVKRNNTHNVDDLVMFVR